MKYRIAILLAIPFAAFVGRSAMAYDGLTVGCGGDYSSIQAAVNAASPWDTITVCPGTYNEDVLVLTRGLTIQSTEVGTRGPNTHVRAFTIGFPPHYSSAHNVTIQGFHVGGTASLEGCAGDNGVGIESAGDYNTIAHNAVYSCNYVGIRVDEQNRGNEVKLNTVWDTGFTGIEIEGNTGDEHQVYNNVVWDTQGEGCIYDWGSNGDIHNNLVWSCHNGKPGINATDSEGLHIHNNAICSENIELSGATDAFVHNNVFYGAGSVFNAGDNKVQHNKDSDKSCPNGE